MNNGTDVRDTTAASDPLGVRLHKVRAMLGLILLGIPALSVAVVHYGWDLFISRILRESEHQAHVRLTRWFFFWNRVKLRIFWLCIGLRWHFVMDAESAKAVQAGVPIVIAPNHYGVIDSLLLSEGGARLGVEAVRVVAMKEVAS
ncbi:MAG: hypothetical protein RLZZ324_1236 [Candidatus Parcubacteria bacterium]|jgi:hypothetical protein